MTNRFPYFLRILPTLLLTACLAVGCSGKRTLGCGDSSEALKVGSEPYGIYKITRYQNSLGNCDQLVNSEQSPIYLVLYSFEPGGKASKPRLGGAFCGDVSLCREMASEASEPAIGYSFLTYEGASGWQGWGISNTGPADEQCKADVQSHVLTSTSAGAIKIETRTTETIFPPEIDGETATCRNRAAIDATTPDLPCKALLVVEASYEAGL